MAKAVLDLASDAERFGQVRDVVEQKLAKDSENVRPILPLVAREMNAVGNLEGIGKRTSVDSENTWRASAVLVGGLEQTLEGCERLAPPGEIQVVAAAAGLSEPVVRVARRWLYEGTAGDAVGPVLDPGYFALQVSDNGVCTSTK